jgi:hypothetical protein
MLYSLTLNKTKFANWRTNVVVTGEMNNMDFELMTPDEKIAHLLEKIASLEERIASIEKKDPFEDVEIVTKNEVQEMISSDMKNHLFEYRHSSSHY